MGRKVKSEKEKADYDVVRFSFVHSVHIGFDVDPLLSLPKIVYMQGQSYRDVTLSFDKPGRLTETTRQQCNKLTG